MPKSQYPRNMFQILTHGSKIHQEITVKLKCVLTQGDRQEISMLVFRCDMNAYNIPIKKQLSHQMMVTHVDMLRIRVRHGVLCQLYCTLVVLKSFHAWHSASGQNETPHVPYEKILLDTLRHGHVFGLRGGKRNAFLRPRKPVYCCASTHHYSTRH